MVARYQGAGLGNTASVLGVSRQFKGDKCRPQLLFIFDQAGIHGTHLVGRATMYMFTYFKIPVLAGASSKLRFIYKLN